MILEELIFITLDTSHPSLRLRFPFSYLLLGAQLVIMKTTMHISDHIHEWRRRRRLIKFWILDKLLTDWFTTLFVGPIARDIAMGACVTEEQAIALLNIFI